MQVWVGDVVAGVEDIVADRQPGMGLKQFGSLVTGEELDQLQGGLALAGMPPDRQVGAPHERYAGKGGGILEIRGVDEGKKMVVDLDV